MDFLPILRDPVAFETLITHIVHHITSKTLPSLVPNDASSPKKIDAVVGLDARGFLIGPIVALRLGAKFVPVRKAGKLPGKTLVATYEKEYGSVRSFELLVSYSLPVSDRSGYPRVGFFRDPRRCYRAGRQCDCYRRFDCHWCVFFLGALLCVLARLDRDVVFHLTWRIRWMQVVPLKPQAILSKSLVERQQSTFSSLASHSSKAGSVWTLLRIGSLKRTTSHLASSLILLNCNHLDGWAS